MRNEQNIMYINKQGIEISEQPDGKFFYVLENSFNPSSSFDSQFYKIENDCIELYDNLIFLFFESKEKYYSELYPRPTLIGEGGYNSDFEISKELFEIVIEKMQQDKDTNEITNKLLYLMDIYNLIGVFQSAVISINDYIVHFFIELKSSQLNVISKNGVFYGAGMKYSIVFSHLQNIFTSIFTAFDILIKLIYEVENLPTDWNTYPKLKSNGILYGDHKKIRYKFSDSTIFKKDYYINLIESLRNEFTHNHNWEAVPKIHFVIEDLKVSERFIYFPDLDENGNLVRSKNRKRFFSKGVKVNDLLPDIIENILNKFISTLAELNSYTKSVRSA